MGKLFNKIFFRSTSWVNVMIASLGYTIGMVIILQCFNLYLKFSLLDAVHGNYISINKEIKFGTLKESQASFSKEEVEDMSKQPFVKKIGTYGHARFNTKVILKQYKLHTLSPLESVPDEFIDCELPHKWRRYHKKWDPDNKVIPVIVSRDLFNMINLSFTFQQGLPQVSEEIAMALQGDLTIWEGDKVIKRKVQIVGFTDRISSILVPESFLNWANKELLDSEEQFATRVIMETTNSSSAEFEAYMKAHNYGISLDDLNRQKLMSALYLIISIIASVGAIFMALTMALIIAQLSNIVLGAKEELQLLLQMGYSRSKIASHFNLVTGAYLLACTIVGLSLFAILSRSVDELVGKVLPQLSTGFETEVIYIALSIFGLCLLIAAIGFRKALSRKG